MKLPPDLCNLLAVGHASRGNAETRLEAGLKDMKVAIACSGLGHVHRGIESWAQDLFGALAQSSMPAELFGAQHCPSGSPTFCLRRSGGAAQLFAKICRVLGGWRYGMGSAYDVEQNTFAASLWFKVRNSFDILHVQDPQIARVMNAAHRMGISRPKVLWANGTGEAPDALRRLSWYHHLTPEAADLWAHSGRAKGASFVVPNFVDTNVFVQGDKAAARRQLGLPENRMIVLCCAAIRRPHKRIDHLLEQFAAANRRCGQQMLLVVSGGREAETDELIQQGHALLGEDVRFLVNLPRAAMTTLYQAADLFVLPSLFETFGIVLLEAMACGTPVICHEDKTFRYVTGPGAYRSDFSSSDGIEKALLHMFQLDERVRVAQAARAHVLENFSVQAVLPGLLGMYRAVHADGEISP